MSSKLKLLQRLGIEYPIFLSPMAGVSSIGLAAAITNSGGLGSIPLAPIDFRQTNGIEKLDKLVSEYGELINKSRNVVNLNFFCHEIDEDPTSVQINNWRDLYKKAIHVTDDILDKAKFTNGNISIKQVERDAPGEFNSLLEYLESLKPKIVSFHFGVPSEVAIHRLQNAGVLVFVSSTSLKETVYLTERGVDGIVLQGYEAGGHRGNFLADTESDEKLSTESLFNQSKEYLDSLKTENIPYLVPAGGIVSGETINHYISQGAASVQLGTAFLATPESLNSKFFNNPSINKPTIMTDLVSGKIARAVKTDFINGLIENDNYQRNELPPYGYVYNAYKSVKPLVDQDIGFHLAGTNYQHIEKNKSAKEVMNILIEQLE
ncbi:hypothetical protein SBY92_004732 [Candida maltosa Xu316]|uniref:Uncharacterized protein n=1 Tax=Candida maltosa (strain Xu316) TaxID=1245528 RepID=M3JXB1_CANMX|nr:hypothetical protein G210_2037 [Candida maltosa Xu316]